jgi:hypothetical protein
VTRSATVMWTDVIATVVFSSYFKGNTMRQHYKDHNIKKVLMQIVHSDCTVYMKTEKAELFFSLISKYYI